MVIRIEIQNSNCYNIEIRNSLIWVKELTQVKQYHGSLLRFNKSFMNKFLARTEHRKKVLFSCCQITALFFIWQDEDKVPLLSLFVGHRVQPPRAIPDREAPMPQCTCILFHTFLSCVGQLLLYQGSFHCTSISLYFRDGI